MKKLIFYIAWMFPVLFACESRMPLVKECDFCGEVDDMPVVLHTLKSDNIIMQVTNYGGRVVSLFVPDRNGNYLDVVLGHSTIEEYVNYKRERFLGAVVGPVANRIYEGKYSYEGVTYQLNLNHNGKGTLHGGFKGLDSVMWDVLEVTDSSIVLHYLHRDSQEGFPGNLDIQMTYILDGNVWRIEYKAQTDKTRPVNISNHPYFNLNGEGNGTCHDYILYVNADTFIGTDGMAVIENPISVDGTPMDYRSPHSVGEAIKSDYPHIVKSNAGFDHNYCINGEGFRMAASLYSQVSGICMEVWSDQPGLQLYSGQWWTDEEIGKYGGTLDRYGSFTFETQNYPDAPNKSSFPNPFLKPGETYNHICEYRFSSIK